MVSFSRDQRYYSLFLCAFCCFLQTPSTLVNIVVVLKMVVVVVVIIGQTSGHITDVSAVAVVSGGQLLYG